MPITVKNISAAWQDGSGAAGKAFVVTKRLISDTTIDFMSQTGLKSLRDAVGEPLDPLGTLSLTTVLGMMRIRSMQIMPVEPSVGKVFDAVITYGTEYMWAEIGSPGTPQLTLPVEVSFAATERTVASYRNRTFTTQPSANLNTTADIGGTAVDEEGRPVEGRVASTTFGLSLVFDVSQTGKTLVGLYDDLNSVRGRWNSASFLHWTANQVICTDADVTQIRDEFYRVTYRFRWDEWYDCEQTPLRDNDNVIKLNSSGKASAVYWRSINRGTANFDSIVFDIAPDATLAKQMALEGSWLTYP
jgi:hypothetical protein